MKDRNIISLLILSALNLFIMHYSLFSACNVERQLDDLVYVDNFLIVFLEVVFLYLFFSFWGKCKLRIAALSTAMLTLFWSFCNLVYSRFFYQYLSFSAVGESMNLLDPFVFKCIIDGLKWTDIYYVISFIVAIYLYQNVYEESSSCIAIKRATRALLVIVLLDVTFHIAYCMLSPNKRFLNYIGHRLYTEQLSSFCYSAQPVYSNFQRGSLRVLGYQIWESIGGNMELSDVQKKIIKKELGILRPQQICASSHPKVKNVIFVLVESYMSFAVDMKIGGKEVTPFLNSLKRDPNTYYNGNLIPNITLGESSDGQFIYMTGLLPLRSAITVTEAKKHSFPGLSKQLSKAFKMKTRMVIPTAPSMWNQDLMCKSYGIDKLYSTSEYKKEHSVYLSDEQVFDLADSIDNLVREPFFSMILSFSMHQPYLEAIDKTFIIEDSSYPKSMINYLNACHYTDNQIRKYFKRLKDKGIFNNTLIVIASDHHVAENALSLPSGITRHKLPLFIINSRINQSETWKGDCNQLDVYTTILDVLGVDSPWRGLGHSLISTGYKNSVDASKWDYSEWIIKSGYFHY